MTKPRDFAAFISSVAARLQAGEREYGNRSFNRPAAELAGEIEEELLDVCAWSFILWCRLRRLHGTVEPVECASQLLEQERHDQHTESRVEGDRSDQKSRRVSGGHASDRPQRVGKPQQAANNALAAKEGSACR